MPVTDKVRQPAKMLHGGASMTLAESVASLHAASLVDDSKFIPVTIEINGSHLQSVSDGSIIAYGKLIERRWDSLIIHEVEIIDEETEALLSSVRVTNYYKPLNNQSIAS